VVKVVEKFDAERLIRENIERTGTDESFFIADVGDVVQKFMLWNKLMPRIAPDFAFKCNNHPSVAGTLAVLGTTQKMFFTFIMTHSSQSISNIIAGAGYDCASKGEIERVR
jgi:diaminopimelate decarboxylase